MSFGQNSARFKSGFGLDGAQIIPPKIMIKNEEEIRLQELLRKQKEEEKERQR